MARVGIIVTVSTVAILAAEFMHQRTRPLPAHGWLGLAILALAEWLMFAGVEPAATYFTAIAWTAYLLIVDAAVFAVNGRSHLRNTPGEVAQMALLSVPLWMIFELYNLRLQNWTYVGLPKNWLPRWFGFVWAFATITPALLLTAELVQSYPWFAWRARRRELSDSKRRQLIALGAILLILPLFVPKRASAYLFAFVWLGFIFLLDPINDRLGLPSLIGDLRRGDHRRLYALLVSGWVCGWLWEFWNYWAAAKWHYVFPILQQWKVFEMPVAGYFGFPPFALECFVMYVFAARFVGWAPPARLLDPIRPQCDV